MKEERVRIVDIAEELGLSTATVSNVIHGKKGRVSAETVKRVEQLLEEKQYIPSMAGMLLAQNDSKIIGVVVNDHSKYEKKVLQDPFISNAVDHLSELIAENDYFLMIKCTSKVQEIIRFASMWNMEGMVLIGFCDEDYDKLRSQMHIPFVVYDGFFKKIGRFANISVDDFGGGYKMGKYLISMGHRKIMYLSDNRECTDENRFLGLKRAMVEAGLLVPEKMFFLIPFTQEERMVYYEQHLKEILNYTAAFAASDVYAIEFMNFLYDRGIKVPEQLSVAGFDDIPACQMVRPTLTTIHQDGCTRAALAMEMLAKQRNNEIFEKDRVIEAKLIVRNSVSRMEKH